MKERCIRHAGGFIHHMTTTHNRTGSIKVKKNKRQEPMIKTEQQKEHMELNPEVTSTANTENAGLSDAESRALNCWESYKNYCRRTVVEAWKCGRAFQEVFKGLSRGAWGPWLDSKGINKSTADRLRLLFRSYGDIPQLDEFASVDQALSAARSKRKGPVEEVTRGGDRERGFIRNHRGSRRRQRHSAASCPHRVRAGDSGALRQAA